MANFGPIQNPNPSTDCQNNIVTVDYVRETTRYTNFGANPSTGGFWANGWNITLNYLLVYTVNYWSSWPHAACVSDTRLYWLWNKFNRQAYTVRYCGKCDVWKVISEWVCKQPNNCHCLLFLSSIRHTDCRQTIAATLYVTVVTSPPLLKVVVTSPPLFTCTL